MRGLYNFYWDCGRIGYLEGVFVADSEEVKKLIGSKVYFGEVLGKHSEIYGVIESDDMSLLTEDQDFIDKALEYGVVPAGRNPLDYLYEDNDVECGEDLA